MISFIGELLTSGNTAHLVAGLLLLVGGAAFATCGIALAFIDTQQHRMPNRILYPWAGFTLILLVLVTFLIGDLAALGRALGSGLGWAVLFLAARRIHPPSIGMGDVKLTVILGMYTGFLGWEVLLGGVALSFLIGGGAALWLLITKKISSTSRFAFGPFLILGTATALVLS